MSTNLFIGKVINRCNVLPFYKMVDIIQKVTYNVRKGQSQAQKAASAMLA